MAVYQWRLAANENNLKSFNRRGNGISESNNRKAAINKAK